MTDHAIIAELAALLDAAQLAAGDAALAFDRDHSDGTGQGVPIAAVFPTSTEQVAAVVRLAAKHGVPIVPQGTRSGLAGGANAVDGCLLLSLEGMTSILSIDVADQVVTTQAGVITFELARAVAERGLFYPPDPGSWAISTIGGNIATNAGGMRCVKYGVTGDFVRELTVVLASGEIIRTGHRTVKGVAGLDLTSLIVGSEGTLGIVTEATLALLPTPGEPCGVLAAFPSPSQALAAADAIMASGRRPSILEYLDAGTIAAISSFSPSSRLPAGAGAALIIQSDEAGRAADDAEEYAAIAVACGATTVDIAQDAAAVDAIMEARRMLHGAMRAVAGASLNEDVSVPRSRLAELLKGIAVIGQNAGVDIFSAGHIGDGNLHPIICFDPADAAAVATANDTYQHVIALAISLGGTASGEHGIGSLKRAHLDAELGPTVRQLQRSVKHAFDPAGLLNPGKKL
ncbi:FAD-binding oxidoreductase [Salinibacterium hongtaonis]|uniref:FAD-binding oxidoreductase n=1 Tax=Homoserinimonas hongtaonis TaxID=2079791 RepID=UPI000D365A6C|nr:FAD-linked oxidase C-terminal domain-containing protein [Salinibacterium hongtaonis]AWB88517.1 FAD-binding oxidoreductase [Salinibacterium hongtaonis]